MADVLELHELFCAFLEAEESLGFFPSSKIPRDQLRRAVEMVRALTGLNPVDVIKNAERFIPSVSKPETAEDKSSDPSWKAVEDTLLRMTASALSACNIGLAEETAAQIGRHPLAHRCRVACEWLRLFLFRRGAEQGRQVRAAGEAYAQGRLSIEEVASVIGVSKDEAICLLERYGYFRPISTIRLRPEDRKARLARLRADRIQRNGVPGADKSLIMRDVVASQRIEDLDARPWLPTIRPAQ
jgi:hypothetical protein